MKKFFLQVTGPAYIAVLTMSHLNRPKLKLLRDLKRDWLVIVGSHYGLPNLDPRGRKEELERVVAEAMAGYDCPDVCRGMCNASLHLFNINDSPFTEPQPHLSDVEEGSSTVIMRLSRLVLRLPPNNPRSLLDLIMAFHLCP